MEPKTTIQGELEAFLRSEGRTINQFAGISGVNSGTLSSIINGNRPIAMQQLDRITAGMGLAEGTFYELYIDECIIHATPDWRRLGPFLNRCAELNKLDCIRQVVHNLMDNVTYAQALFDTAEEFFRLGKREAAALLYEGVAESEKYQHSERLALCHYRLFTIASGDDNKDTNLRAATQFEYFVERLDEADQLDALLALAKTYLSLQRWSKAEVLAEELGRKAFIQYQNQHQATGRSAACKEPQKPLCYYILYAQLLLSAVSHERGDYEQAIHYASLYADMSWIQEETESVRQIKEQFKEWSKANTYRHRLMAGQQEVLPDYVEYISDREQEILPALLTIMQAANRYRFNVDGIIERFRDPFDLQNQPVMPGEYIAQAASESNAMLLYELAAYYVHAQCYKTAIHYTLKALESSVALHNGRSVLRCVGLFEESRHVASPEELLQYKTLIREADV